MRPKDSLLYSQEPTIGPYPDPDASSPSLRPCVSFHNKIITYGEDMLAHCLTPKLEDYHLSAACNCLLNIFTATLHI
jgi:hypothetical protein